MHLVERKDRSLTLLDMNYLEKAAEKVNLLGKKIIVHSLQKYPKLTGSTGMGSDSSH